MVAAVVSASRNLEKCPEVFWPENALSSSEATLVTGIGLAGRTGECEPTWGEKTPNMGFEAMYSGKEVE